MMEEWRSGGVNDGGVEEWKSGGVEEWKRSIFGHRRRATLEPIFES